MLVYPEFPDTFWSFKHALKFIRKKAGAPPLGLLTVAAMLFVGEHAQFPAVDHFVLNETEITLPPFLADLAAGHPQRIYATAEFPDIRRTPAPRWQLADLRLHDEIT